MKKSGTWIEPGQMQGRRILPGITLLTGYDLTPFQTKFRTPELADPYMTRMQDSVIISGTAQYHLKFRSLQDLERGGPYQVVWNDFYYSDGTPMEGERFYAHSWDMKPVLWNLTNPKEPKLWNPETDKQAPTVIWYGGHMRPPEGQATANWPTDNYSRDVFAFVEKQPGKWFSMKDSIFSRGGTWPRPAGNFRGHRYGHQIIMVPKLVEGKTKMVPVVFYEEVTEVRPNGSPAVTKIFMDEMESPFQARGNPVELISPIHPATGQPYPSAKREDGSALVEGPLYFRFLFDGEPWEAIGFSAGSFYGKYIASFASRKVSEGLQGQPFRPDLNDAGTDFHDAGAPLAVRLGLAGGPGRPAVLVNSNGMAELGPKNLLQVLVHGYRKEILPDNDYTRFPVKYRLDQMFRVVMHAFLKVTKGPTGSLRFQIDTPSPVNVHTQLPLPQELSQAAPSL